MEHEIDLPPIPVSQKEPPPDLSDLHHQRKRARLEYDLTTSSDPALFSSDDYAPTSETYASKRRKQKWQGTWWGEKFHGRASHVPHSGRRKFTRNVDSGVWMGSEGTDTSLEDELLEELQSAGKQPPGSPFPPVRSGQNLLGLGQRAALPEDGGKHNVHQSRPRQVVSRIVQNAPTHAAVENVIERCLEEGAENVDLSSMSLEHVPNQSLRRLRSLTKHTTIQEVPPSEDTYSPIEATLRLYLSNNAIATFPSEILNLTNIRVLSLRHNRLTNIPPGIAKLPHLEHLNVAANKLQYLPYELIHFYDRPEFGIIATPNPFHEYPSSSCLRPDPESPSSTRRLLRARSTPTYFRADSSKMDNDAAPTALSRAPSLLELAVQSCKSLPDLADIKDWCTAGEGPTTLSAPLALAMTATEYGLHECTVCSRSFIIPRVQWLEWWTVPKHGITRRGLPFLRQGCSWACNQDSVSS